MVHGDQQIHLHLTTEYSLSNVRKKAPLWNKSSPSYIVSFHTEMGRDVCCNKSNTMLVGHIQNVAGYPGK